MNSPLENRKVRLRGLGGPAACGVPRIRAVRNQGGTGAFRTGGVPRKQAAIRHVRFVGGRRALLSLRTRGA
jgi:hypothetical protein